jgi:hypothetical protein
MDIRERAAAALVHAREARIPVPATELAYRQRLRAALTRDVATLLAVPQPMWWWGMTRSAPPATSPHR